MPRIRIAAGDRVAWDLAGHTFIGVVDHFTYGRRSGYRSMVVRFDSSDYDRYSRAIDLWGRRESAAGHPSPSLEFPIAWVMENLTNPEGSDDPGYFEFGLHTDMVRRLDPEAPLPSREPRPAQLPQPDPSHLIRPMTTTDAPEMAAIAAAQGYGEVSEIEQSMLEGLGMTLTSKTLVCEADGRVAGYVTIASSNGKNQEKRMITGEGFDPFPALSRSEIMRVRVRSDQQRQGVGRSLIRAAFPVLLEDGHEDVRALTDVGDDVSEALMRSAGLHPTREMGGDLPFTVSRLCLI